MKHTRRLTLILTFAFLLLSTIPVMAGEWHKVKEDQWQYIQDDGTTATGWLEVDSKRYYLDDKGCRKSDYWLKDDGAWYYLDKEGVMVTDTWVDNYYVDSNGRYEKKR